ncbi:12900_t:CDS:2 [Funneliformis mosseae]|uniref:12900_t:CDS:1 n=1 Tax=Funneliformis mosseae TaxID=27381 RepID=A0A9N9FR26_FUNMO|nr:12900_t:CDS:2 [Funneliformis mosseae]
MSSPKKPKISLRYKYQDNDPVRIRLSSEEPSVSDIETKIINRYNLKLPTVADYEKITKDNPIIVENVEAQALNEIWVRYEDQTITLSQQLKYYALNSETPISELYNTNENALEIVIDDVTSRMSKLAIHDKDEPNFEYVSLAFNHEFKDDSNYVQNFHNYITLCHHKSKDRDSYMPYISIVQSSGYGKSRLIKEYARQLAKDPVKWFNNFLVMAISLIDTKHNPSEFWERHPKDNGDSIWEPAIEATNACEITKNQELKISVVM